MTTRFRQTALAICKEYGKTSFNNPFYLLFLYSISIPVFGAWYWIHKTFFHHEYGHSFLKWCYFSVVTITSLGFGDAYPEKEPAMFIVSMEILFGIVVLGLLINSIATLYTETQTRIRNEDEQQRRDRALLNVLKHILSTSYRLIQSIDHLTTPQDSRRPGDDLSGVIHNSFTLQDMKDIFEPATLLNEEVGTPWVSLYFNRLDDFLKNAQILIIHDLALDHLDWNNELIDLFEKISIHDAGGFFRQIAPSQTSILSETLHRLLSQEDVTVPPGSILAPVDLLRIQITHVQKLLICLDNFYEAHAPDSPLAIS